MGRMYVTCFSRVAVTAVQDFFELQAASNKPITIHEVHVSQDTEAGDAAAEMLPVTFKRAAGSFTSGSGGSTHTPTPLRSSDSACGESSVEINNTTQASAGSGTLTTLFTEAFHVANGLHYLPTPEARIELLPTEALVVSLAVAPADSTTMSGRVVFEEHG